MDELHVSVPFWIYLCLVWDVSPMEFVLPVRIQLQETSQSSFNLKNTQRLYWLKQVIGISVPWVWKVRYKQLHHVHSQTERKTDIRTYISTERQRFCVRKSIARFEVLRAVWTKVKIFRIMKPCWFQNTWRRFGGSTCHCIQQKPPMIPR